MKIKESGKDKVKKICDILRKETLEPAKAEADLIIAEAQRAADSLIKEAHQSIEQMKAQGEKELESKKTIFQTALVQSSKQAVEALKQTIEDKLFNKELGRLVQAATHNPKVIADMITALTHALEKEGMNANLSAYIAATVPTQEVNLFLSKEILDKLREKSVLVSAIGGGVELKVHDNNITLDLSDKAIRELIANYIRKDFREIVFQEI